MKFQSKWRNATYVVRQTQRVFYPDSGYSKLIQGLIARFEGNQRLFDSEKSQRDKGWTDEERIQVENHLLGHPDWKHGLYLAYGETIPEDRQDLVRVKDDVKTPRCSFLEAKDGDFIQCPKPATVGRDWCQEHEPEAKIHRGMATA